MEKDLKSVQNLVEEKLREISKEGNFDLLMLFNDEGLPMIQIPATFKDNKEDFAAISIMLSDSARVAETLNPSLKIDEALVIAQNKYKIVSRIFYVNGIRFNLVALIPPDIAYRKFTNKAIKALSQIL